MDNFVDVDLPLPKRKKSLENVNKLTKHKSYFREYCNCTSIHGFRYFGENRTISEKIWWAIVFSVCLVICIVSIISVYKKWDHSPVIVSFATKGKPIYDIPFPAVTVCSESKILRDVFDYKEALFRKEKGENLSETEETFLSYSSFICNHLEKFNYSSLNSSPSISFVDVLEKINPKFSIINCAYLGQSFDCNKYFTPIITDEGICYTFNMIGKRELFTEKVTYYQNYLDVKENSSEWSLEYGYDDEAEIEVYPQRALLAGASNGLKFELKISKEKSYTNCKRSILGYKILFHSSIRFPRLSQQFIRIPLNQAFAAAIRPTQIMTSEAVKNYPPHKRMCFFPSEKKLEYFNAYTQSNCNIECFIAVLLKECGCVLFFMPKSNGTRICGDGIDYECARNAEYNFQIAGLQHSVSKKNKNINAVKKACDCLPMCTTINYQIGTSQSDWNWSRQITDDLYANSTRDNNFPNYHLTKVTAYFISSSFIGSERNELYGPTDFLANFGGLLGLFTGFSVLSLMEIIYFLTIRIFCNIRLYGNWAGNEVK